MGEEALLRRAIERSTLFKQHVCIHTVKELLSYHLMLLSVLLELGWNKNKLAGLHMMFAVKTCYKQCIEVISFCCTP